MKKKLVTFLMAMSVLLTSVPSTVFAGTLQNVGDTDTQNAIASFTVAAQDLGDITVSIPDSIELTFDSVNNKYATDSSDKVYAYGYLDTDKKLEISTATTTTFTNSTSNLTGNVTFGTAGVASWSSSELLAGHNNESNKKSETVDVEVTNLSGILMGQYTATMTFNVETKTA